MFIRATRGELEPAFSIIQSNASLVFRMRQSELREYGSAYWLEMTALEQTHPGMLNLYCFADREKRTRGLQY